MIALPAGLVANWKAVLGGLLLAALALQTWRVANLKDEVAACEARNLAQVSEWRARYAEAVTEATQEKARIEGEQAQITTELSDDYQRRLGAFLGAYNQRLRETRADTGGADKTDLPRLAYDSDVYLGPGADRGISEGDARICGVVTLRLLAAREHALKQSQIDRGQ